MSFNYFSEISVNSERVSLLDGNSFFIFLDRSYGIGETKDFLVQTPPDKDILFYGRNLYSFNGSAEFQLFKDTTVSANGTPINAAVNLNGTSSKTTSISIFESPTITDEGLLVDIDSVNDIGVASPGSAFTQRFSKILDRNTNYLVRIINTSGLSSARISYQGVWEERDV